MPYWPEGIDALQPLYQAVAHGCRAGLWEEARAEVYRDRILRGTGNDGFYSTNTLGAFGADLGAVACFFEQPWTRLAPALSEAGQAWLLAVSAFDLRALGRLTESLEPMRAVLDRNVASEEWESATISASNLSELELTLGAVAEAVRDAERSVEFADRNGDTFQRMARRTTLADALHQAGRRTEPLERFREAEAMQAEDQPQYPLLYSLRGFRYCDLLLADAERAAWERTVESRASVLDRGGPLAPAKVTASPDDPAAVRGKGRRGLPHSKTLREVQERAAQTFDWAERDRVSLLDSALDHLTMGRAAFYKAIPVMSEGGRSKAGVAESEVGNPQSQIVNHKLEIELAVSGLRASGATHHFPRALLTRAWLQAVEGDLVGAQADLDDAWQIAERGQMELHLADIFLTRCRLFGKPNAEARMPKYPWGSPETDLQAAEKLINECGYHRRDEELATAKRALIP